VPPNCTCHSCKGRNIHPAQELSEKALRPITSSSLQQSIEKEIQMNPDHFIGKACIACLNTKKNTKQDLPVIYIGKTRKFRICKKSHLADPLEFDLCANFLDLAVANLQESGDLVYGRYAKDLPPPTVSRSANSTCKGFTMETTMEKCSKLCGEIAIFLDQEHYFCCPLHLLRYQVNKMAKGARKDPSGSKKRKGSGSQAQSGTQDSS